MLIDSQVYTDHMARFGGMNISRSAYKKRLELGLDGPFLHQGLWQPDMLKSLEG